MAQVVMVQVVMSQVVMAPAHASSVPRESERDRTDFTAFVFAEEEKLQLQRMEDGHSSSLHAWIESCEGPAPVPDFLYDIYR